MRVERIIELIAVALPELEMRAVASPDEVWAKVDPFKQAICLRGWSRNPVVVHLPPRLIHFLVELTWFKPDLFEAPLDPTGRVVFRVQTLEKHAPRWWLGRYDFRLDIEKQLRFVQTIRPVPVERMRRAWRGSQQRRFFPTNKCPRVPDKRHRQQTTCSDQKTAS